MRITVVTDEGTRVARMPFDGADHVLADVCCGKIMGADQRIAGHDTYEADASCGSCGKRVGILRVKVSTIFGIEEDEAVLNGRPRVY